MSSLDFPPTVRLRSQHDFKNVFERPRKLTVDYLMAFCRQNSLHHTRLGVSVPKRSFKRATDRNTVKRVIRESFRHHQYQLGSLDIVIVVRIPSSTFSKSELRACIEHLWRKVETQFAGA